MIRPLLIAGASLGLGACATTPDAVPEAEYLRVPPPPLDARSPAEAITNIIGRYPESMEDAPTLDVQMRPLASDPSRLEMIGVAGPMLDDSVRMTGWRAILEQSANGSWRVTELGVRYKWYRSENPDEWRAALCP